MFPVVSPCPPWIQLLGSRPKSFPKVHTHLIARWAKLTCWWNLVFLWTRGARVIQTRQWGQTFPPRIRSFPQTEWIKSYWDDIDFGITNCFLVTDGSQRILQPNEKRVFWSGVVLYERLHKVILNHPIISNISKHIIFQSNLL